MFLCQNFNRINFTYIYALKLIYLFIYYLYVSLKCNYSSNTKLILKQNNVS